MTTLSLLQTLQSTTMLEIDGLYASEFGLDEGLHIECMDGRARKVWSFTPAQVEAAVFDQSLQSWVINSDQSEHRIVCLDAFAATDDDDIDLD